MGMGLHIRILILLLCLLPFAAWAQDDGQSDNGRNAMYEAGFHLGNLLPNQIQGVTEIMGLGGVRGGIRLAPYTYAEAGAIAGEGHGQEWKNGHVDARMDIPIENLIASAYIGADGTYYRGSDNNAHMIFGGHAGGAIQALLTGHLWFRGDMKFGFSPGTSLYIGFGFVFRFGEVQQ